MCADTCTACVSLRGACLIGNVLKANAQNPLGSSAMALPMPKGKDVVERVNLPEGGRGKNFSAELNQTGQRHKGERFTQPEYRV